MTSEASAPPRWRRILGSGWFHVFAAIVVTSLVLSFVAKPYWVPSGSMEETLQVGDRVIANRLAYLGSGPAQGDIVVFEAGPSWEIGVPDAPDPIRGALRWIGEVTGFGPSGPHTLVKRVIGEPGQTVSCCSESGALLVNGAPLLEPYVYNDLSFEAGVLDCTTEPRSTRCFDAVTVPSESYLMLGDNRAGSSDSAVLCRVAGVSDECWRWAEREDVVGKVFVRYWPIPRWATF